MKRFVLTLLLLLALPGVCFAAQSALSGDGYRQALSGYDLSAFEKLGDDANSVLEQLGLDDFDFETVTALDAKSCVQVLGRLASKSEAETVRKDLESGSIRLLKTDFTIPERSVDMCTLKEVPPTAAAAAFMEMVRRGE